MEGAGGVNGGNGGNGGNGVNGGNGGSAGGDNVYGGIGARLSGSKGSCTDVVLGFGLWLHRFKLSGAHQQFPFLH